MIFLWNPTKEDFTFQYGGLNYTISADSRKKVLEPMGNHALNALGARGLTRLIFDDDGKSIDEEKIKADSVERNREFKIRQIVTYNERNERRKASGQPYDPPTPQVKKYALDLGITLLQPYAMADAERGKIGELSKENDDLKTQINKQSDDMKSMMESMKQMQEQIANGFVRPKDVAKDSMVTCSVCGDEVLASKYKSHMSYRHKEGS